MSVNYYDPVPYYERDPLLVGPKTPPPSYYAANAGAGGGSGKESTLPSYQEITTRIQGLQESEEVRFLFPETQPSAHGGLAAVAFFCCCFSPLACIALYYSARVKDYYQSGLYSEARTASRRTYLCSLTAITLGLTILLLTICVLSCMGYSQCKERLF